MTILDIGLLFGSTCIRAIESKLIKL